MDYKKMELDRLKEKVARIELGIKNEEKWMKDYDEEERKITEHHLKMDREDLARYKGEIQKLEGEM